MTWSMSNVCLFDKGRFIELSNAAFSYDASNNENDSGDDLNHADDLNSALEVLETDPSDLIDCIVVVFEGRKSLIDVERLCASSDGKAIVLLGLRALLHDIGKMGIPDSILLKAGPLSEEEWKIMKMHPVYAHDLLYPITFLRPALDIPYCHHEKSDGTGYPRGLTGDQIPMAAKLFAPVDIWDALTSDRPYRKAWSPDEARKHLVSLSGTHLDPNVVGLFLQHL